MRARQRIGNKEDKSSVLTSSAAFGGTFPKGEGKGLGYTPYFALNSSYNLLLTSLSGSTLN